jgi:exo-1,4-beta-D-glucosaminidase
MTASKWGILCLLSAAGAAAEERLWLKDGWAIESSAQVHEGGAVLSTTKFQPRGWYPAKVPSTVAAALAAREVFPDPHYGMNLRSYPGVTYPIAENFSNIAMPPGSPFRMAWWYRTEFRAPDAYRGKMLWLRFDGINYRANIWLNGRLVAGQEQVVGAYRVHELNVTRDITWDGPNVLAVEVSPPQPDDLAITFVDWNPAPPDKNMGLWHGVSLAATGPVAVRWPQVVTKLDFPSLDTARLTVAAELQNGRNEAVAGTLRGRIGNIEFAQQVKLEARQAKTVRFTPDRFAQLQMQQPKLWWPWQYGPQNLHELTLEFEAAGAVSDRQSIRFGIREVTSELTDEGHRLFRINGRKILIRGAGWTSEMMLRQDPERQQAELRYVRDMNLNTIRLEGKLEDERFYELTDRLGLLAMPGWCCCDHWEQWEKWDEEDHAVAAESLRDQARRLRSHPSVFVWLNGSDGPPPAKVEEAYLRVLKETDWPNPVLSSATEKPAASGPSGVKMRGPYEYVAPSYWYLDTKRGGAYGFNTETGPGPSPPPVESLRRMLPASRLWPVNEDWEYHCGGGPFRDLRVFTEALEQRFGKASNLEDYAWKAQVLAYESHRAMFEAFGRNKYTATGVIQWMLNNAWPSMIWHLYDYYLRPGGSYFGAKKACEPLHIQYSYDDRSVVVVNSWAEPFHGLKAAAKVLDFDLTEKFSREAALESGPDSVTRAFVIPEIPGLTTTYFVALTLADSAGKVISRNFYWLSAKPETPDWDKSTWYHTPTKTFADLTSLERLPEVRLDVSRTIERRQDEHVVKVSVRNPARSLAFAAHVKVTKGEGGEEVLPVLWEDNYFPLLPGEKREVTGRYRVKDLSGAEPVVVVDGWNVGRGR